MAKDRLERTVQKLIAINSPRAWSALALMITEAVDSDNDCWIEFLLDGIETACNEQTPDMISVLKEARKKFTRKGKKRIIRAFVDDCNPGGIEYLARGLAIALDEELSETDGLELMSMLLREGEGEQTLN